MKVPRPRSRALAARAAHARRFIKVTYGRPELLAGRVRRAVLLARARHVGLRGGRRTWPVAESRSRGAGAGDPGVTAPVDGHLIVVGKRTHVAGSATGVVEQQLGPGELAVYVAADAQTAGTLEMSDRPRDDARATMDELPPARRR